MRFQSKVVRYASLLVAAAAGFVITGTSWSAEWVTRDGRYVAITVDKTADHSGEVLVIQSTADTWKKEIPSRGTNPQFTADSRKILYSQDKGLVVLTLGTEQQSVI